MDILNFNPNIPYIICIITHKQGHILVLPLIHLWVCFLQGSSSTFLLACFSFLFIRLIAYITNNKNIKNIFLISLKFIVEGMGFLTNDISKFYGLLLKERQRFMSLFPCLLQQANSFFEKFNQEVIKDTLF